MLSPLPNRLPGATRPGRLEICPPGRPGTAAPWLQRVRAWLAAGWPGGAGQGRLAVDPGRALANARRDFIDSVDDIATPAAEELLDRIHFARSLRELWHLRAEIFSLVSLHHSQREADERLADLNRHFTSRSPRSGFGALTSRHMWP